MQILLAWQGLLSTHLLLTAEICHCWTWTAVTPCPSSGALGRCQETSELGIASHSRGPSGAQPVAGTHYSTSVLFSFQKTLKYSKIPFKTTSGASEVQALGQHQCWSIYSRAEIQAYCAVTRRNKENEPKSNLFQHLKNKTAGKKPQIIPRNDRFTICLLSFPSSIYFSFSVWLVLHWWSF